MSAARKEQARTRRPRGLGRLDRAADCMAPAMHKHLRMRAGACACLEVLLNEQKLRFGLPRHG